VLVPIIAQADVSTAAREKWLARLWDAIREDKIPYLEYLMDCWGELWVTKELASIWADHWYRRRKRCGTVRPPARNLNT
jgi:hypothetical protein